MGIRSVIRLLFTYIPNGLSIHLSLSLILLFLINGISSQLQLSDEIENYPSISDIIDEDVLEILRAESVTRLEHDDAGRKFFLVQVFIFKVKSWSKSKIRNLIFETMIIFNFNFLSFLKKLIILIDF